jgi:hypothetical protein
MQNKFKIAINVLFMTTIIGLAVSYLTILLPNLPDLNFLEAVGVYCILLPLNELVKSALNGGE